MPGRADERRVFRRGEAQFDEVTDGCFGVERRPMVVAVQDGGTCADVVGALGDSAEWTAALGVGLDKVAGDVLPLDGDGVQRRVVLGRCFGIEHGRVLGVAELRVNEVREWGVPSDDVNDYSGGGLKGIGHDGF